MKELTSVVTRKGQITVPIEIRRALNLREGDTVALVVEDGEARLRRVEGVVSRTAGLLKGPEPPLSAEELREIAERAIAADVIERSRA